MWIPPSVPCLELMPLCRGWNLFIKSNVSSSWSSRNTCCVKDLTFTPSMGEASGCPATLFTDAEPESLRQGISGPGGVRGVLQVYSCPCLSSKASVSHTGHWYFYLGLQWLWWNYNSNNENTYQQGRTHCISVITSSSSSDNILIAYVISDSVLKAWLI